MSFQDQRPIGVFWRPNPDFVAELSDWLRGQRVLEIFAGNGFLANTLHKGGVDVHPTSLRMGHDAHEYGFHCEVEEREAVDAVLTYGAAADVLLICWPTVTDAAMRALINWGSEKPVVFIGETPKPEMGMSGLSGCASDDFFEVIHWSHEFQSYQGNMLEKAGVVFLDTNKLRRMLDERPTRP